MADILSRNVFLDMQTFRSRNFSFEGKALKRLAELSKQGRVRVYLTDVTVSEVKSQIADLLHKAAPAVKILQKDFGLLWNAKEFEAAFERFRKEDIAAEIIANFEQFCAEAKVEIIPVNGASVDDVFARYFDGKPPFGEGRKKTEFPDAFAISALEQHCTKKNTQMYA